MFKKFSFALAMVAANQTLANGDRMELMTIIGDAEDVQQLPSSAFVVDEKALAKFEYTDINRIMRQVPGVYLQEEDGFGLRPNIGIRGAGAERSEKITLLEDGVLIAPAPYSAPAAYYFPLVGRMSGVEVLKGASILRHGPSTVAGVINLISTRIPSEAQGQLNLEAGEFGSNRLFASYGNSGNNWGWLLETQQQESDGFKDIDRVNASSGFSIEDYVFKASINTENLSEIYQQLDIKLQYSEEVSDQTYVGLTDIDFAADENRLYGLTALDTMTARHSGANFRYLIEFNDQLSLTTLAYYNRFKRDWFKVDNIAGSGFGDLIDAANTGNQNAQDILDGTVDAEIRIKHNNREYLSKGLQIVLDSKLDNHQLQGGIRYHEDNVDRFQPTDVYQQTQGNLVFESTVTPSSSNNRVEETQALTLHLMDFWRVTDTLEVTMGLRYENISTRQRRYTAVDRSTSRLTATNDFDVLLWSFGATYELTDQWQLLIGAHSGFAPASPGSQENVDPEKSTNIEAGSRFQGDNTSVSAIAFYSDYENKVTNCSVAFPCGASTSGSQSEGQSKVQGIEFTLASNLYENSQFKLPLTVSYTYTDAQITDPADSGNLRGDALPYVPKNTFHAQLGLELISGWNSYLSATFVDAMCVDNRCARNGVDSSFLEMDDTLIVDLSTHHPLNQATSIYLKVDNLFNERAIVARSPGGARPGKPRTGSVGVKYTF